MFEPTAAVATAAPTAVSPGCAAAASCDDAVAAGAAAASESAAAADRRTDGGDDLQQHRMIVPLDIVTSITISQSLLTEPADTRSVRVCARPHAPRRRRSDGREAGACLRYDRRLAAGWSSASSLTQDRGTKQCNSVLYYDDLVCVFRFCFAFFAVFVFNQVAATQTVLLCLGKFGEHLCLYPLIPNSERERMF
jgi:hypothetical protein